MEGFQYYTGGASEGKSHYEGTNVVELNMMKDFQVIKSSDLTGAKVNLQFVNPDFMEKNGLVVFYAPWCPHCATLRPSLVKLANITKGLYPVGVINATNEEYGNNLLKDYFEIVGYPTIKFFNDGTFKDYNGGRNVVDLLRFMCKADNLCDLEPLDILPNPMLQRAM